VVYLKGVDENYRYVSGVADHLINGEYDLGNEEVPKLILGAGVEGALGIQADRNIFHPQNLFTRKSKPNRSTCSKISAMTLSVLLPLF
jgi:lipoprotein-releasing system permease protein